MSVATIVRSGVAAERPSFAEAAERHLDDVYRYLIYVTGNASLAEDLAAETFANVLEAADRFDPEHAGGTSAIPWLISIARNTLLASVRRGVVAEGARRRLGCEPLALDDEALSRVEEMASMGVPVARLLSDLPEDLREAVVARVLEEREYDEIAAQLGCSQQVVRKRVSRGLTRLRSVLMPVSQ